MVSPQFPQQRPNGGNAADFSTKYGNILQTITVAGLLMSGIYVGVLTPLREEVLEWKTAVQTKISREEHQEFKTREDDKISVLEKEIQLNKIELSALRDSQVTRSEHVTHWEQSKADVLEIRKQVDDLRKDFGGQYSVAEKLKELQNELDQIRMASNISHVQLSSPPSPPARP